MNPRKELQVHKYLTFGWFLAAFPIVYWLSESVPFLVFISVYAVVTGHWSAYQAAKGEIKTDEST